MEINKLTNRNRKILLLAILLSATGLVTATALLSSIGVYKLRAVNAEEEAKNWKRQAGKAYTAMLKAQAGTNSTATIIPQGSRIDCSITTSIVDGRAVSKCEDGIIYPPMDY